MSSPYADNQAEQENESGRSGYDNSLHDAGAAVFKLKVMIPVRNVNSDKAVICKHHLCLLAVDPG